MRKRSLLLFGLAAITGTVLGIRELTSHAAHSVVSPTAALRDGDILFQQTGGEQGRAIQLATGSPWTHVGIAFKEDDRWLVYEAVGPVISTPLDEWALHGTDGQWVAKRWVGADRMDTVEMRARLDKAGERFSGLPYDLRFGWSDDRIYCSELVWKIFAEGLGVRLCEPKPMREHALGSQLVQQVMRERYGTAPPLDEPMISPGALFDCEELRTVVEHRAGTTSTKVR
ncbi:MAG: peptidoglycan peptidase [Flavobacteriales bacterium]|nr:peptidoglycan peptidase [Flavobacteriales bacterium]